LGVDDGFLVEETLVALEGIALLVVLELDQTGDDGVMEG